VCFIHWFTPCCRRHQHRTNGPPPPTPCTTEDTCDDADTCSKNRCQGGQHRNGSKSGGSSVGVPCDPPPPYYGHYSCCHHCYYHHSYCSGSSRHRHTRRCDEVSSNASSRYRCSDAANSESPDCSCGEQPYPVCPPTYYSAAWPRPGKRRFKPKFGTEMNSDTDPFAPPPTPHSQYLSECYTHGETTEADEPLDQEEGPPPHDSSNQEVEDITSRIQEETDPLLPDAGESCDPNEEEEDDDDDEDDDEEGRTTDDADTVLLSPAMQARSARTSPSITEHSFCIYNPPPSPATDSSWRRRFLLLTWRASSSLYELSGVVGVASPGKTFFLPTNEPLRRPPLQLERLKGGCRWYWRKDATLFRTPRNYTSSSSSLTDGSSVGSWTEAVELCWTYQRTRNGHYLLKRLVLLLFMPTSLFCKVRLAYRFYSFLRVLLLMKLFWPAFVSFCTATLFISCAVFRFDGVFCFQPCLAVFEVPCSCSGLAVSRHSVVNRPELAEVLSPERSCLAR